MRDLWVEKYRPDNVGTYVFRDDAQRNQVKGWVARRCLTSLTV